MAIPGDPATHRDRGAMKQSLPTMLRESGWIATTSDRAPNFEKQTKPWSGHPDNETDPSE